MTQLTGYLPAQTKVGKIVDVMPSLTPQPLTNTCNHILHHVAPGI
jgi:hypothetical protein